MHYIRAVISTLIQLRKYRVSQYAWDPCDCLIISTHCLCLCLSIIIIMSCRLHGYPWPSLATSPYRSSPLAGLQCYILYPYRAAVCMFKLVVLLLLGHICGSLMSSSLLLQQCPACLVRLTWIVFVMEVR